MKPTRTKSSGSFHQNLRKRAHLVDLTDINRKHQFCFQAHDCLQPREGDIASAEGVCHYALLMGSFLWFAQGRRPNIAFAVGHCMWFVANLSGEHLAAAKHILRYLRGTAGISLLVRTPTSEWMLAGWADSNWAGSHNCRRSTSGYVFTIGGLVCSWSS